MEGFWTITFQGAEGWGTGVVTLISGKVFGGDEGYVYMGEYGDQDGVFSAHVRVTKHAPGVTNVMGIDEFDLELNGLEMLGAARPRTLHIEGRIPGTESRLLGTLTKQSDLPAR
jgi:hypothetical protein